MNKPWVVAVNANGGGGKTALTKLLHDSLPNSELLAFHTFGEPSVEPDDWYNWLQRGADLLEFDCPFFAQAVAEALARRRTDYLILDYPFGREHPRLRDVIDLSVYIDTPLTLPSPGACFVTTMPHLACLRKRPGSSFGNTRGTTSRKIANSSSTTPRCTNPPATSY